MTPSGALFFITAAVLVQINASSTTGEDSLSETSLSAVEGITCFKCNGVAFPRDCPFVVECGPHEECFVDQLVSPDGNIKYNTGCRDRQACQVAGRKRNDVIRRQDVTGDLTTCTACCDVAHCNYGGCGEKGLPDKSARGPICYDCYQQRKEAGCNKVKICGQDEECHIMKSPNSHLDFTYTTGCITKVRCGVLSILGKREDSGEEGGVSSPRQRRGGICFNCCNGDLCNKFCSGQNATSNGTVPVSVIPVNTMTTSQGKSSSSSSSSMTTTVTTPPKTPLTSKVTPTPHTTPSTKSSVPPTSAASVSSGLSSSTSAQSSSSSSSSTSTTTTPHNCSANTVRYNNHCYYFSTEIKYWEESRQLCKGRNAHLLKIDDINEQLFIEKTLRGLMTAGKIPATLWGYYIGAHLVQGTWEWEDGTPVVFDDWGRNEPDHPDFQIFGLIFMPGHYAGDYKWGSHSDMQGTSRYICESVLH